MITARGDQRENFEPRREGSGECSRVPMRRERIIYGHESEGEREACSELARTAYAFCLSCTGTRSGVRWMDARKDGTHWFPHHQWRRV